MATEATFDNQLQALATATANFANDKDAAIKNTIITSLGGSTQQGGGSTGTLSVELGSGADAMVGYHYAMGDPTLTLSSDGEGNYLLIHWGDEEDHLAYIKIYYTIS